MLHSIKAPRHNPLICLSKYNVITEQLWAKKVFIYERNSSCLSQAQNMLMHIMFKTIFFTNEFQWWEKNVFLQISFKFRKKYWWLAKVIFYFVKKYQTNLSTHNSLTWISFFNVITEQLWAKKVFCNEFYSCLF